MKKVKIKKFVSKTNANLIYYSLDWGRGRGERISTGEFTYKKPANFIQENHNKDAVLRIEKLKSEKYQELNSGKEFNSADASKLKSDFLAYYQKHVDNSNMTRRNLKCSLAAFKSFIKKPNLKANELTEKLGLEYREYLLNKYSGETPGDYFQQLKNVCYAATKEKYFVINPVEDIIAKKLESKKKDILTPDEWELLLKSANTDMKRAALFSLYTGLRWCDVESLEWSSIRNNMLVKVQNKTKTLVEVFLHPIALQMIGENKKNGKIFNLPTHDGANKSLAAWVKSVGINKHITWHSLRHSLSVILLDTGIAAQTVAGMLGHRNSLQVLKTYTRYSTKQAKAAVSNLPSFKKDSEMQQVSDMDKQIQLKQLELETLTKQLELARLNAQINPLKAVK